MSDVSRGLRTFLEFVFVRFSSGCVPMRGGLLNCLRSRVMTWRWLSMLLVVLLMGCPWAQADEEPPASPGGETVQSSSSPTLVAVGTELLRDHQSGLIWRQADSAIGQSWYDAVAYCAGLSHQACTDWRLPTIEELVGLGQQALQGKSQGVPQFRLQSKWLWSSTPTQDKDGDGAWYFHVGFGTKRQARLSSSDIHSLCVCTNGKQ